MDGDEVVASGERRRRRGQTRDSTEARPLKRLREEGNGALNSSSHALDTGGKM